jgi:hypothetical protein
MSNHMICLASRRVLSWMLRFAPVRLRDWGTAMLAELEAIDHPVEALNWSFGCLIVILQEAVVSACLGVCRDAAFWITAKEEGRGMRSLRIAAVSTLAVTLGFFIAPSFRQAMGIAAETLDDGHWVRNGSGEKLLGQARINAERQRDAKMLAYVAVHEERIELAQEAADQAVAIDPQWTWVYYVLAYRDLADDPRHAPAPQFALWIEKLRHWDPQNAMTYLLEAEGLVRAVRLDGNTKQEILENKTWAEMMARGFDAPKYDSYFRQGFNLDRDIAMQRGFTNPLRFTVGVVAHPLPPSLIWAIEYERFILSSAKNPSDLMQQAQRVAAFGERMMAADTDFEQVIGNTIALDGYRRLQQVAAPADQALISARLVSMRVEQRQSHRAATGITNAFITNAVIVQVCFVFIVIAAAVMIGSAGISVFRYGRASRKINLMFCTAVAGMLVACIVAFVAYLPYTHLVAQAMDPQTPVRASVPMLLNFLSFAAAPQQLLFGVPARAYVWIAVLMVLSFLALWLGLRQFRRPGPQHPVASAGQI